MRKKAFYSASDYLIEDWKTAAVYIHRWCSIQHTLKALSQLVHVTSYCSKSPPARSQETWIEVSVTSPSRTFRGAARPAGEHKTPLCSIPGTVQSSTFHISWGDIKVKIITNRLSNRRQNLIAGMRTHSNSKIEKEKIENEKRYSNATSSEKLLAIFS